MLVLDESEAKKLLIEYGIPTTNFVVVNDEKELEGINLEYPLVMKVCSRRILHKTDVGGVILDVINERQLREKFEEMKKRFPGEKILIEEMEKKGIEMIVGITHDKFFGKVVMVGMGGIYTELYKDVSFRKIPLKRKDAEEMLKELKAYPLFEGFRNVKGDREAIINLIMKVASMEHVYQMDLNPVFVYEKGLKVIDAKVVME